MLITLYYLSGNTTGGWVTYTAHLTLGLVKAGADVRLVKIGNRTETKSRPFGYGLSYWNMSLSDCVKCTGHRVIVALQKNYREKAAALLETGAWMVVHDPAEFANLKLAACSRYITIRKAVQQQVSSSVFIPHPYLRHYPASTVATGKVRACSISRIDFDKHTDILLDANRLLPKKLQIQIHGFENRLYTRFKICPAYPEWTQSVAHYPRERTCAVEICHDATYSVDMSIIKGDGGGTQYTFMEAADAGSVNVIHRDWLIPGDEMVPWPEDGANCLAVVNGDELAQVLTDTPDYLRRLVFSGKALLTRHDPTRVGNLFINTLRKS